MRRRILAGVLMFGAGCSTVVEGPDTTEMSWRAESAKISGMSRRFISLRQILPDMTRKEVAAVLGDEVVIGYQLIDEKSRRYKPITVPNPYRKERFVRGGMLYVVDYYLAGIKTPDGKVTDDELIPFVFAGDKLVGTGWLFLKKLRRPEG